MSSLLTNTIVCYRKLSHSINHVFCQIWASIWHEWEIEDVVKRNVQVSTFWQPTFDTVVYYAKYKCNLCKQVQFKTISDITSPEYSEVMFFSQLKKQI